MSDAERSRPPVAGVTEVASVPGSTHARTAGTCSGNDRISILLVDDERRNLTALETVLSDPDYRVVCAESAEQALLALVSEQFAVLVLDIQMPGMNGFELAQLIKQREKTARVPIIFLTAYYSEDQHVLEGYFSGAVDYLHKPINPAIIRSKVAVFAELYRKNRENARVAESLRSEVAARRSAEEELRRLNDELEERVAARTEVLLEHERELRILTEALQHADRRKNEFLATLAHELRNPLAPLKTGLELLGLSLDPATANETRGMMNRQLSHLVRLIGDLMDLARIQSDRLTLKKERLLLGSALDIAVEASQPVINAFGHRLGVTVPDEPIWLDADPARLAQAICNLLTNAAKYTPERGTIELSGACEGSEVVICVKDSGLGIPPSMLTEVFQMFTQVNRTLDRSHGGLGIGLALVKRLVELHGGSVAADSAGLSQGSTFTIRLPLARDSARGGNGRDDHESKEARSRPSPRRVLVVDDNVDGAVSLAKVLEICGHEVRTAHTGEGALGVARLFQPEVVFLDLGLPGMSGFEAATRLRGEACQDNPILVALTGWGNDEYIRRSREAGFDFHVTKPVDMPTIESILAGTARRLR
jgi:signal transduction histidine kinase